MEVKKKRNKKIKCKQKKTRIRKFNFFVGIKKHGKHIMAVI